jgi:hypothetical protein
MNVTPKNSFRLAVTAGIVALFSSSSALGQGCVIARGGGACLLMHERDSGLLPAKHWQAGVAMRWFESHRHFAGAVEQTHRDRDGTEVLNNSWFYDASLTYAWTERLNVALTLPFVHHDRSSLYEHLGNASGKRFTTRAAGLGDVRLSASYWLFNPTDSRKGNLAVSFGFKAPTGDFEARDTFIRSTGPQERFVDSSIHPGDGGWG